MILLARKRNKNRKTQKCSVIIRRQIYNVMLFYNIIYSIQQRRRRDGRTIAAAATWRCLLLHIIYYHNVYVVIVTDIYIIYEHYTQYYIKCRKRSHVDYNGPSIYLQNVDDVYTELRRIGKCCCRDYIIIYRSRAAVKIILLLSLSLNCVPIYNIYAATEESLLYIKLYIVKHYVLYYYYSCGTFDLYLT